MTSLLLIALLGLGLWFWLDSARARELATGICQEACQRRGLQFLDGTVVQRRMGLRWTDRGARIRRMFRFDYSEEGVGRHDGHIILLGIRLEEFSFGLPTAEKDEPPPPSSPDGSTEPSENNVLPFRRRH